VIQEGDEVFIPEAGTVYVDGAVQKPGNYPIRSSMSIQEAIAAAGGLTSTADRGKVKLIRYLGNGKRDIVDIDANSMKSVTAVSLKLKDRDVVFVENNALRSMLYGLNFSVLGTGVGYTPPVR
jgi:polysaccharide export outer membrane protein